MLRYIRGCQRGKHTPVGARRGGPVEKTVNDRPIPDFQRAIRATHGARSQLRERVRVVETFQGETVWQEEVLVSDLLT